MVVYWAEQSLFMIEWSTWEPKQPDVVAKISSPAENRIPSHPIDSCSARLNVWKKKTCSRWTSEALPAKPRPISGQPQGSPMSKRALRFAYTQWLQPCIAKSVYSKTWIRCLLCESKNETNHNRGASKSNEFWREQILSNFNEHWFWIPEILPEH